MYVRMLSCLPAAYTIRWDRALVEKNAPRTWRPFPERFDARVAASLHVPIIWPVLHVASVSGSIAEALTLCSVLHFI